MKIENRKSQTILFHRSIEENNEYKFGKSLKGQNKFITKLTRANSLYLSTAAQNNNEILGKIYRYFKINFLFRFEQLLDVHDITSLLLIHGTIEQISYFLKRSGTGIEEIELKVKDFEEYNIKLINNLNEAIALKKFDISTNDTIKLTHKDQIGNLISFTLDDESLGTKA
jgi:hypothetical protein